MDCLPRDLPASAFTGTQLFSMSLNWLWLPRAAEAGFHTGPQAPGTGTVSGLYIPVSSVPSHASGTTDGQEALGLMTAMSLRMTEMEFLAQAVGRSWLIKAQPRRFRGNSFPQLGDTLSSDRVSLSLLGSSKARKPRCLSRHGVGGLVQSPCSSMPCPGLGLNMGTLFLLLCT